MRILQIACLLLVSSETTAFLPATKKPSLASAFSSRHGTALRLDQSDVLNGLKEAFAGVDNGFKNVVGSLDKVNIAINEESRELLRNFLGHVQTVLEGESALQQEFLKYVTTFSKEIDQWLLVQNPEVDRVLRNTLGQLSSITLNTPEAIALTTVVTYFVISSVLTWGQPPPPSKPYPQQRYDPVAAQAYFDGRSAEVATRALQIAFKSLRFGIRLLQDYARYA